MHFNDTKEITLLSAYNEYCGINVEAANINMKLVIGNRISGTGNREPAIGSLFLI